MRMLTIFVLLFSVVVSANQNISLEDYANHRSVIPVPTGNRNANPPDIPGKRMNSNFDAKYNAAMDNLQTDTITINKKKESTLQYIKQVAQMYKIDPAHIIAAIVGEHTFNVSMVDDIQGYVARGLSWAGDWSLRFKSSRVGGYDLAEIITFPQFSECNKMETEFNRWNCINEVWDTKFSGKRVGGNTYPAKGIKWVFFNPLYSGHTYGLGQMGPERALMVADLVHQVGGFPMMNLEKPAEVYKLILNPESAIHFIAATSLMSIKVYAEEAGFDISQNPGLTATLYNIGKDRMHAKQLFDKNIKRIKAGQSIELPQENYYGWLINHKMKDIEALLEGKWRPSRDPGIQRLYGY